MKFAIFAKHLQSWPLETAVTNVREARFDGFDLTVRPGGYVEPQDLSRALPAAVKLIRAAGLEVPLLTTALTSPTEPFAEATLRAAADVGVREIKLGYWPYDGTMSIMRRTDDVNRDLDGFEKIARSAGVRVNIHNHSGDHVNNSPFTVAALLRDRDPARVGCYFDAAHFTIEGGLSAWKHAVEILSPRICLMAIKDNKWIDVPATMPSQERRWVPVGSGNVHWPAVLGEIKKSGYDGWASIHGEYQGRWTFREMTSAEVLQQCIADREVVSKIWHAL